MIDITITAAADADLASTLIEHGVLVLSEGTTVAAPGVTYSHIGEASLNGVLLEGRYAWIGMDETVFTTAQAVADALAPITYTGPALRMRLGGVGGDPAPNKRITKLAFRNRHTAQEKAAIEFAAIDNPAGTMEQRMAAAALRAAMADQRDASYIDLDRAETRAGVEMLEAAGLLAAGRAAEILDAPVQASERYNG